MTRKITVPGVPLEASIILGDNKNQAVIAVPHAGEVVVVFYNTGGDPSARSMTNAQMDRFREDVRRAHEAMRDDAKIAEMEKEFGQDD